MPSAGLLSRRQFLISMFAPAIAKPATKSEQPLPGAHKPEFWFGEKVEFCWIDETSGKHHTESGEIVGANWNHPEVQWEYQITWHSSTAYPASEYPIFDGNLVTADVLSRVKTHQ
ncbi:MULTISPECIES: hypothetical protein [unclassified Microcoleus]|uniref:hypothetical protein n=1 Tax=unclassified Microcoleus TaxID=2642155 RepID=UPI002FD2BD08